VSDFETVLFEKSDCIARVTLNRPQVLNVYNLRMRDELFEVFSALADDDEVRVLVLSGAGRAFCAGADLTEFGTAPSPVIARQVRFARDVWAVLNDLPFPKIAAVHGFAFGSGLELALFCDFRFVAVDTQLAFPEVKLGFIPAAGGTQTLPRTIGQPRALDMLLTGRRVDAAEALTLGLITRVLPRDQLASEVDDLARHLAALNPALVTGILKAVKGGAGMPLESALMWERQLAAALR
jgi:enoyl-CoA hydratase/carnithine racemase